MESEIEKLRSGLEQIRAENKAMENKKLTEKVVDVVNILSHIGSVFILLS